DRPQLPTGHAVLTRLDRTGIPAESAASALWRACRDAYTVELVGLNLGIVGLPNVGKSTLFNALTRNDVLAANYPFATIEPNECVVPLPDPRLDKLAELFS